MFSSISRFWLKRVKQGQGKEYQDFSSSIALCKDLNLDNDDDKSIRQIRHLIKLNHTEKALIDQEEDDVSLNATPDVILAAYRLKLSDEDISDIFESIHHPRAQWNDSPAELSEQDWMDHIGQPNYQRAFLDFFEDAMVERGYDWHEILYEFLFTGNQSLIDRWHAGRGLPLTRLRHALETGSRDLAAEALTLFAALPVTLQPLLSNLDAFIHCNDSENRMAGRLVAAKDMYCGSHQTFAHIVTEHDVSTFRIAWTGAQFVLEEMQSLSLRFRTSDGKKPHWFSWLLQTARALYILQALFSTQQLRRIMSQWWWQFLGAYIDMGCPSLPDSTNATTGNYKKKQLEETQGTGIPHVALPEPELLLDLEIAKAVACESGDT